MERLSKKKALEFAKELNLEKFQASDGWLHSWKARYNISFKEVSGESKSVTPEMTAAWKETSLPTILSRYQLKDIYNADQFGLFYKVYYYYYYYYYYYCYHFYSIQRNWFFLSHIYNVKL